MLWGEVGWGWVWLGGAGTTCCESINLHNNTHTQVPISDELNIVDY